MPPATDLASLAGGGTVFASGAREKLARLRAELEPLARRYDVVVANPPYMGSGSLAKWSSEWVKKQYPDEKSDLCTSFIERGFTLSRADGFNAMVTMQSWMFLGSYEKMRGKILRKHEISSMAHLGTRAFGAIGGEVVSTTATVFGNTASATLGTYFRLVDMGSETEKLEGLLEALADPECGWLYHADTSAFAAIPGSPIAYWASKTMVDAFLHGTCLNKKAYGCNGLTTGDNALFLRHWSEVSVSRIDFHLGSNVDLEIIDAWVPYNKGGEFQKWAAHLDNVINWKNGGSEIKSYGHLVMRSKDYMLRAGFSWSKISSGRIAMRRIPEGFMFDVAGLSLFPNTPESGLLYEAFVNSGVASAFLSFLSPTLNFEVGNVTSMPLLDLSSNGRQICELAQSCSELVEE